MEQRSSLGEPHSQQLHVLVRLECLPEGRPSDLGLVRHVARDVVVAAMPYLLGLDSSASRAAEDMFTEE